MTYFERLAETSIETIDDPANAQPEGVAEVPGISDNSVTARAEATLSQK